MNVITTFQRVVDVAFTRFIDEFIVVYQDDIKVFSKKRGDHLENLENILIKCTKFGLSLNLRKFHFGVQKENMLGHIVS